MSAPSVSGNQPLLFVSIMFPGPIRTVFAVSPRVALRPLRSGCPYRASHTCLSFRSLWACRACCPGVSLGPCGPVLPVSPVSPRSPLSPFGPCGPAGPVSSSRSRFAGWPRQGRCHHALLYLPSAPEDPRAPVLPLVRVAPTTVGIRFTASSAAILLCSADCCAFC